MDYSHLEEALDIRVEKGYGKAMRLKRIEVEYNYGFLTPAVRTRIANSILERVAPTAQGQVAAGFRLACDTYKLIGVCSSATGYAHLVNFNSEEFDQSVLAMKQLVEENRYRRYGYVPRNMFHSAGYLPGKWRWGYSQGLKPGPMRQLLDQQFPKTDEEVELRKEIAQKIRDGFSMEVVLHNVDFK